jgi:hypothetical protein
LQKTVENVNNQRSIFQQMIVKYRKSYFQPSPQQTRIFNQHN